MGNDMKPRALHRSPGIFGLGKSRKTSARGSTEGCEINIPLKCGPLPPNEVGRVTQHDVEKGRKQGK